MRTSSGISWCWNASRAVSRTRARNSRAGGIPREVRAEREHVDEVPDQRLGFRSSPVGDRRPDGEVVLSAPSAQEDLEGRQQRHEQRDALAPAEGADRLGEFRIDDHRDHGPARAPDRRPWPIRGQLQGWHAREPSPPAFDRGRPRAVSELLALPEREVGVLDRRLGQRRGEALAIGLVERRQLAGDDAEGPAVGDEVVHRQQRDLFALCQPEQADANEGSAGQVERSTGIVDRPATGLGLPVREP